MLKKTAVLIAALALGSASASAATFFGYSDGGPTTWVEDGGVGDNSGVGDDIVTWDGTVGVWDINFSGAFGAGAIGVPNLPSVDLVSFNHSADAGILYLTLVDTDLTSTLDPLAMLYAIGGTTQGSILSAALCWGSGTANAANLLCGVDGDNTSLADFGPLAGPAFATSGNFSVAGFGDETPFALKMQVVIEHNGAGSTSFDANLAPVVPEPATILLFSTTLLGLGFMRRRKKS